MFSGVAGLVVRPRAHQPNAAARVPLCRACSRLGQREAELDDHRHGLVGHEVADVEETFACVLIESEGAERLDPQLSWHGVAAPRTSRARSTVSRMGELDTLLREAAAADARIRIEFRDRIAAYGCEAIARLEPWLCDPRLGAFAVRTIERAAAVPGAASAATTALERADGGARFATMSTMPWHVSADGFGHLRRPWVGVPPAEMVGPRPPGGGGRPWRTFCASCAIFWSRMPVIAS